MREAAYLSVVLLATSSCALSSMRNNPVDANVADSGEPDAGAMDAGGADSDVQVCPDQSVDETLVSFAVHEDTALTGYFHLFEAREGCLRAFPMDGLSDGNIEDVVWFGDTWWVMQFGGLGSSAGQVSRWSASELRWVSTGTALGRFFVATNDVLLQGSQKWDPGAFAWRPVVIPDAVDAPVATHKWFYVRAQSGVQRSRDAETWEFVAYNGVPSLPYLVASQNALFVEDSLSSGALRSLGDDASEFEMLSSANEQRPILFPGSGSWLGVGLSAARASGPFFASTGLGAPWVERSGLTLPLRDGTSDRYRAVVDGDRLVRTRFAEGQSQLVQSTDVGATWTLFGSALPAP